MENKNLKLEKKNIKAWGEKECLKIYKFFFYRKLFLHPFLWWILEANKTVNIHELQNIAQVIILVDKK